MNNERCVVCGDPFTDEEWEDRHSPSRNPTSEAHDYCCPDCNPVTFTVTIQGDVVTISNGVPWDAIGVSRRLMEEAIEGVLNDYGDHPLPRRGRRG